VQSTGTDERRSVQIVLTECMGLGAIRDFEETPNKKSRMADRAVWERIYRATTRPLNLIWTCLEPA